MYLKTSPINIEIVGWVINLKFIITDVFKVWLNFLKPKIKVLHMYNLYVYVRM